ncbi:hypothetical protein DRJ17_06100 [Candidatus Woesearchaeota archaeon]|nr:MAG: hypothetical protein DRJ17_06100 [Candidatus Woesearchaeota archaeon]
MANTRDIINVEIIDKNTFNIDITDKHIFDIDLKVVDVIYGVSPEGGVTNLKDLIDVNIDSPSEKQVLIYDNNLKKWINTNLESLLSYYRVIEIPIEVSSKIFRTSQPYISGQISVYVNGLKEVYFTELNNTDIELEVGITVDDVVEVEYIRQ